MPEGFSIITNEMVSGSAVRDLIREFGGFDIDLNYQVGWLPIEDQHI